MEGCEKKRQIGVPVVHTGNYRSNPPSRNGWEDTDRGWLRAWCSRAKCGPIPSKTNLPKILTGVGPTSAKNYPRRQEVADEKPFRYTTAGYPISHRGQAMDTQCHRLRYSGVEQPHRESSGRSACAFGFPKPIRGDLGAPAREPRRLAVRKKNPPTHPQTFGISKVGKARPAIHTRKRGKRREDEITVFSVNLTHPHHVPKPTGRAYQHTRD